MRYLAMFLMAFFLFGCISSGAQRQIPTVSVDLQVGKTTKTEIINALGTPAGINSAQFESGYGEQLIYYFYPHVGFPRAVVRLVGPDGSVYTSSPRALNLGFMNGILVLAN